MTSPRLEVRDPGALRGAALCCCISEEHELRLRRNCTTAHRRDPRYRWHMRCLAFSLGCAEAIPAEWWATSNGR